MVLKINNSVKISLPYKYTDNFISNYIKVRNYIKGVRNYIFFKKKIKQEVTY